MNKKEYWFRPKKFWKVFAFYHPANSKGWLATVLLIFILLKMGVVLYYANTELLGFVWQFLPWVIAVLAIFDTLCFRLGEYPAWWKKKN